MPDRCVNALSGIFKDLTVSVAIIWQKNRSFWRCHHCPNKERKSNIAMKKAFLQVFNKNLHFWLWLEFLA